MPNKREVIAIALRRIGVLSADEAPSAEEYGYCEDVLDSVFAEFSLDVTLTWTLADVPSAALVPLGNLLAAEIAQHYSVSSEPRSRAWSRLRAVVLSDDREDRRDVNEDNVISEAEEQAGDRALFY